MQSMTDQFKAFVRTQNPERTFNPWASRACVGFQFLEAHGYPVAGCGVTDWLDTEGVHHELADDIKLAISWACDMAPNPFSLTGVTYGDLAAHLETVGA